MTRLLIAVALLASASGVRAGDICTSLAHLARVAYDGRARGVTVEQAAAELDAIRDQDARAVAGAILWTVYVQNQDGHLTSPQIAAQVRAGCLASSKAQP